MNYFDKISKNYKLNSFNIIHRIIKKKETIVFKKILKKIKNKNKISAIDIGAGSGFYSNILYSSGIRNISCIDSSKNMLRQIKINNVKLINKNFLNTNYKLKFDLIIAMGILEFLPNYKEFIKKISSLSKKNTIIIILMPKKNVFSFFYFIFHLLKGNIIHFHKINDVMNYLKMFGWVNIDKFFVFPVSNLLVAKIK
tara:strand:- start:909 stop:1499 length:591 start_codon:yes stop_codon:yes gene_type:complete